MRSPLHAFPQVRPSFAEYPPVAFWSQPPAGLLEAAAAAGGPPTARADFLFLPLNELADEHYTIYVCRPQAGQRPPGFCV